MNVLESREGRPLRLRPWVLLVGAAVVVVGVVLGLTLGASSPPPHTGPSSATKGTTGSGAAAVRRRPRPSPSRPPPRRRARRTCAPNTPISLTFSAPVSLRRAAPTLTPEHRRQVGADQPHHADLRPRLAPHPLLPGDGDHPWRRPRPAVGHRSHAASVALRRVRRGRRRHASAAAAAGPAATTCRSDSPRAAPPPPGRTWRRTSPAPSPGAGPACPPS